MKIAPLLAIGWIVMACSAPTRPAPHVEIHSGSGVVRYIASTGEWQLVDTEGKRLVPTSLSPTLKVNNLKVYFSYEVISTREDGTLVVRLLSMAIE